METIYNLQYIFRKHLALPQDHGSWVFILSPLCIGLFGGESWSTATIFLVLAAFSAFLVRQPVTIAVKAYSGRRSRRDLVPAFFWILVYGLVGLLALTGLVIQGFGFILLLGLPGLPVFAWHLFLVSKRSERRQMAVEVVGSGVLALAAPAGLWIGAGYPDPRGWWLFVLVWLQSAASIVYAYLRLEQRPLASIPPIKKRLAMGTRAFAYSSFNLGAVTILSLLSVLPILLPLPYLLQWTETIWGTLRPAVGEKPVAIGTRQLIVSTLFTILFILTWRFSP
jgi:hypothetical protein